MKLLPILILILANLWGYETDTRTDKLSAGFLPQIFLKHGMRGDYYHFTYGTAPAQRTTLRNYQRPGSGLTSFSKIRHSMYQESKKPKLKRWVLDVAFFNNPKLYIEYKGKHNYYVLYPLHILTRGSAVVYLKWYHTYVYNHALDGLGANAFERSAKRAMMSMDHIKLEMPFRILLILLLFPFIFIMYKWAIYVAMPPLALLGFVIVAIKDVFERIEDKLS